MSDCNDYDFGFKPYSGPPDFSSHYMGGTMYRLTPLTERAKTLIAELACKGLAIESKTEPGAFRVEAITMVNYKIGGAFAELGVKSI